VSLDRRRGQRMGLDLLRAIRSLPMFPCIITTVIVATRSTGVRLELGADDYNHQPFRAERDC